MNTNTIYVYLKRCSLTWAEVWLDLRRCVHPNKIVNKQTHMNGNFGVDLLVIDHLSFHYLLVIQISGLKGSRLHLWSIWTVPPLTSRLGAAAGFVEKLQRWDTHNWWWVLPAAGSRPTARPWFNTPKCPSEWLRMFRQLRANSGKPQKAATIETIYLQLEWLA